MTETEKTRGVTVGDLKAGMVMSMPDTDLPQAVISAISEVTYGNTRQILLTDPDTGQDLLTMLILPATRQVVIHEVFVARQSYKNVSSDSIVVTLSKPPMTVEAGAVYSYTGLARPDVFPNDAWLHTSEAVQIERQTWSAI